MACIPTTVKETKRDYILNTSKDKLYNRNILYSLYQAWKKKTLMIDKTDKYLFTEVFSKFELHIDNPFCE